MQLWVRAFRDGIMKISVNTDNGVERKNRDFKYEYLSQYKNKSLSGMLTVLFEQFLPDKQCKTPVLPDKQCKTPVL